MRHSIVPAVAAAAALLAPCRAQHETDLIAKPAPEQAPEPAAIPAPSDGLHLHGWAEFAFYPPHNEYDPSGRVYFQYWTVGRYSVASDFILSRDESPWSLDLYSFLLLGGSHPKVDYNYRADPILIELRPAVAYDLCPTLQARFTYDDTYDLGDWVSRDEVNPWMSLALRWKTDKPLKWNRAELTGFVQGSFYLPGFEFPASPGASPAWFTIGEYQREDIVNARYGLEAEVRLGTSAPRLKRGYLFANPQVFFGDATLFEHWTFGAQPISLFVKGGAGWCFTPYLELRFTHSEKVALRDPPDTQAQPYNAISIVYRF